MNSAHDMYSSGVTSVFFICLFIFSPSRGRLALCLRSCSPVGSQQGMGHLKTTCYPGIVGCSGSQEAEAPGH